VSVSPVYCKKKIRLDSSKTDEGDRFWSLPLWRFWQWHCCSSTTLGGIFWLYRRCGGMQRSKLGGIQDETWHGGRPWPRPHCIRWGPSCPQNGQSPQIFGPCLLWPNGWMDQDATWYGGRPRPRWHCVTWGPNSPKWTQPLIFSPCLTALPSPKRGTGAPIFSAHVYCSQMVAHLSYCWALVE